MRDQSILETIAYYLERAAMFTTLAYETEDSQAQFDEYLYRAAQCYNEAIYFFDKK